MNQEPVRLYKPYRENGIRHRMNDCLDCAEDKKETLLKTYFVEKVKTGPSRANIEQVRKADDGQPVLMKEKYSIVERLEATSMDPMSPSCMIKVTNGSEVMCGRGYTDDGSNPFIVSAFFV